MQNITLLPSLTLPIETRILIIRGYHVLLDRDLALLYGVTTKVLKQAVKRNIDRFPDDFMFKLSLNETKNLRSQIVTSSLNYGGDRYMHFAFTEQGIAMLSSVLRSPRAIKINIQIMRAFVQLRKMISTHEDLRLKLDAMELRYDEQFKIIFDAMRELITEEETPKNEIGF